MALLILAVSVWLLTLPRPGEAGSIPIFTGNTFLSNLAGPGIDGTVNYAVFTGANFSADAAGILAAFMPGLGSSPALDLGAVFVYVFQVTNGGTNTSTITNFSVGRSSAADVTSWGYFNGAVFTDAGGNVGATNPLDSGGSVGFFLDSGINPSLVFRSSTSLQAAVSIPGGSSSSLIVYTSHFGPDWYSAQINGLGIGAMGVAPGPSPVTNTIPVGHQPDGVAVNSLTNRIYVANEEGSSVSVIDGASNNVTTIDIGRKPRFVAVDPVANRIYVTRYFCRCVSVIDGATNLPIAEVPVAGNPNGIDVNPATGRVYVATIKDSTQGGTFDGLVVIDGASNTVLDAVTVGTNPVGVAVNPSTNWVYVTNAGSNTISVVDGATALVLATIFFLEGPDVRKPEGGVSDDIGVNPDTNRVYAPNPRANTVAVVDGTPGSPTLHTVIASVAVGNSPISVAIDRSTNRIYVANAPDRTVSVIDGATNDVISTVAVEGTRGIVAAAGGLGVNTTTHRVYVSHQQEDFISFFDTAALPPPEPPALPPPPEGTISGRVLDPNGNVVGGTYVQVCPIPREGFVFICDPLETDTSGAYVSQRLLPGVYNINAFPPATRPDLMPGELLSVQFVGGALIGQDVRLPGRPTRTGAISGRVTDESSNPLEGARVQACLSLNNLPCALSEVSDTLGHYRIAAVPPGTYDVKAFPPAGSTLIPAQLVGLVVVAGAELTGQDLHLAASNPPPPGAGIGAISPSPSLPHLWGNQGDFGPPGQGPIISMASCPGGTASFTIDQIPPKTLRFAEGTMTETPLNSGQYTAEVHWSWNTWPSHEGLFVPYEDRSGPAALKYRITCPNGTTRALDLQVYVDPSGTVKTPAGTPIVGATVTLFRSDTGSLGSFDPVPDGDAVMSPSNRRNPDTTNAEGRFSWDVLTGFYFVRAEKAGCYAPGDPSQPFVESPVLTIPPAVVDIGLVLTGPGCPDDTTPPTTTAVVSPSSNANGWNNTNLTVTLTALDNPGGSGVKEIVYSLSGAQTGGSTISGSSTSVTISAEGLTTLTYFARDNAGNQETAKTLTIRIDKTPPNPPTAKVTPTPIVNGWNNTAVNVSFASNGDAGGAQSGVAWCTGTSSLSGETAGTLVSGTCIDLAGNTSAPTPVTVKIDRTPPTVSCSINPSILWPPNDKLVPVTASVTVMDALSGPAGFTLVSVTSNEPNGGRGHRDRPPDIQGFVLGTPDTSGLLRAERSEHGAKRVYTLIYRGFDLAGNSATCSATVTVPHGRRDHDRKDDDRPDHDRGENEKRE